MNPNLIEHKENLRYDYFLSHKVSEKSSHINTYHAHDALEVILIHQGSVKVNVNEEKFEAGSNSVLLFSPADLHAIIPQGEIYDRYVLYFKPEFLNAFSNEAAKLMQCFFVKNIISPNHIVLTPEAAAELITLFDQIIQCYDKKTDIFGQELEQKYLIALALIKLNRLYQKNSLLSLSQSERNYQIVYNSIIYIQNNIDGDLSLSQLSAINYIGKNRLCQAFASTIQTSPLQYVLRVRIAKAKHLLCHNHRIDDVCEQCGFKNLSHFSRAFRSQVGLSPKQFSKSIC